MSDLKPKAVQFKVKMGNPHEPSKGLLLICYFMLLNVLLYIKKLNEHISSLQSEILLINNRLANAFLMNKEQSVKTCTDDIKASLKENNDRKKYDLIIYGNSLSTLIYFSAKKFQELIVSNNYKVAWIGKFSPHVINYKNQYTLPLCLDLYPETIIVPELTTNEITILAEQFSISIEKIQQVWQKLLNQSLEIPSSTDMDIIIDNALDILEKLTLEKKKSYRLQLPKKALQNILDTTLKHIDHYPNQDLHYQEDNKVKVFTNNETLETESLVIAEEPIVPALDKLYSNHEPPYVITDKYESISYLNYYLLPTEKNYILAYHNGTQLNIWSNSQQLLKKIEGNNNDIRQEPIRLNDLLVLPSISVKNTEMISFTGASYLPATMSNIRDLLILYELMME